MKKSLASTKRNSDLAVVMGRFCPLLASLLGFPPESIPLQKDTARDEDGHFKVIQLNDVHLRSSYFFVSETLNLFHPIFFCQIQCFIPKLAKLPMYLIIVPII